MAGWKKGERENMEMVPKAGLDKSNGISGISKS